MLRPKRLYEKDFDYVEKALVEYYTNKPDTYGLEERNQDAYIKYAKFIVETIKTENLDILDFGTGSWRIIDEFSKYKFGKIFGIDYFSDAKYSEYKSKLNKDNVQLIQAQSNKLPFENESLDIISSLCVIEHLVRVEDSLSEFDRVLKPGGYVVIACPNWSSVTVPLSVFSTVVKTRKRYWQFETFLDVFLGIFRSYKWYLELLFSSKPKFIRIFPRMQDGKINFEKSDDDAVHLCQPLSFKKYFLQMNYEIVSYNEKAGTTPSTFKFNKLFPNHSTTNLLVFKKL